MKKLLLLVGLMGCASLAQAQAVRVGPNTVTQQGTVAGASNVVIIPPGAQIQFCNSPANAVPCSNKATTYTDATGVTPCPTSTQIVLDGTDACVANPDQQGNWGVWVTAGNYQYTITTPNGTFGPYFVTAGGTGGGGGGGGNPPGFPGTSNVTCGALNNGSTDDAVANTNCINALATNGGTTFLGNNTLWTPPIAAWTAPSFYENILLQGQMTVKTNPWDLRGLQVVGCGLPYTNAGNTNFSFSPTCTIQPAVAGTPSTVLSTNVVSGGFGPNTLSDLSIAGFTGRGIYDQTINMHMNNVFSVAASTAGLPYESVQGVGQFGKYFRDGGFETVGGSINPSMLFHTMTIGSMYGTFIGGNGILDESTLYPNMGAVCGQRAYYNMLYENSPVFTTPNAAFHTYDLTGCTYSSEVYINTLMSDSADHSTPLIAATRTSGSSQLQDTLVVGAYPSGPLFQSPADRTTYITGSTVIGGVSRSVLGLYYSNSSYNLLNSSGALFNNIGAVTGVSVGATGVGLAGPYQLVCSASNSGGSLAAGSYYVLAAYEDTLGVESQLSDELGPFTTTGSSGSISCTWNEAAAPATIIAATRFFIATGRGVENVRFRTTSVGGPYVITGSGGASASPVQFYPNPANTSLTTRFGANGGEYTGTENCFAFGKQGCTTDTTPGDVQIAGNLNIAGLVTCGSGCGGGGGGSPGGSSGQIQYNAAGSFGGVPDLSFTAPHTLTFGGSGIFTFSPGATVNGITPAMIPTLNQNTSGSAATLLNSRLLAGNSFNGSANVPFTNKFIVQGTTDSGLPNAQFLGALATGILKNTTSTGVLTAAASSDVYGLWTGSCTSSTFLRGDGACATPAGTISGLTAGYIPKAGTATSITANSAIDDSITTASTITSTEPVVAPSFTGSGSGAGYFQCTGGTIPTLVASAAQVACPASVTTNYTFTLPASAGTGALRATNTSNVMPITIVDAPTTPGHLDQTGVSTANSGSAQVIYHTTAAGQYVLNVYADQSAGCTTVGSGSLVLSVAWTDATHARDSTGNTATLTPGTAATGVASYVSYGPWYIYAASGTDITVTDTYTACMTGTWTYDQHTSVQKAF